MGYFKDLAGKLFSKKIEKGDWVSIDRRYFTEPRERFAEGIAYRVDHVGTTPEGKTQVYLIDNKGNPTPIGKHLLHKEKKRNK